MRRIIVMLGTVLALTLFWANISLAQAEASVAEGNEKAAAGDFKGALSIYQALTLSQPDSHEMHAKLGGMQLLDQRYSDAVKSFQRAITLGDTGTRSFLGMGIAYLHMGLMGPARAAFVEAKSRGPEHPQKVAKIIEWIDTRNPQQKRAHP